MPSRPARFIAPQDPLWVSTLRAMDDELVTDSLVYRYDPSASPDGLQVSEGTFSLIHGRTGLGADSLQQLPAASGSVTRDGGGSPG